jgi:CheY-like chemotaxis protein
MPSASRIASARSASSSRRAPTPSSSTPPAHATSAAGGISFLVGGFVYPGVRCRVQLVSEFNHRQTVYGVVTRCRYVEGSGTVYDVGVQFDRPVDVALFQRRAITTNLLLADDDTFQHQLVEQLVKSMSVRLTCVTSASAALAHAREQPVDLALVALELPDMDGLAATRELRRRGFSRPIAAVSAAPGDEVHKDCLKAGCTSCIFKPVSRSTLETLIDGIKCEPLISALGQEVEMGELIDAFVGSLSGTVSALEIAFGAEDFESLERIARTLKGQGGACGFDIISDAAEALRATIGADRDLCALRTKLNELVRWCLAARPANC